MAVYAVIMAGGTGTRLWPMSRRRTPKQLIPLIDDRSLYQGTISRIRPLIEPENTFVVAGADLVPKLAEQSPGIPVKNFIVEPQGKGTAPCIGLAAIHIMSRDPDGVMAVLPADHHVSEAEKFHKAIRSCLHAAEMGHLVTMGIKPTYPSTGYGYIKQGPMIHVLEGNPVHAVEKFIEKPDEETAARLLREGSYTWNSGMFVWKAARIMEELGIHMPLLHWSLAKIAENIGKPSYPSVLHSTWAGVPTETIDYGVMEKAEDVAVVPTEMGWSDIGSWSSLKKQLIEDENHNTSRGDNILIQTSGSMVLGGKRLIAAIGLRDILIVDTEDALLVCQLRHDQRVRDVVAALKADDRLGYL